MKNKDHDCNEIGSGHIADQYRVCPPIDAHSDCSMKYHEIPENEGACIIILKDSDQARWYSNQAGGYACRHPVAFGSLYFFGKKQAKQLDAKLMDHFVRKHGGWCTGQNGQRIDEDDCVFIEKAILKFTQCSCWRVNRSASAIENSMEAWIYMVNICTRQTAILVWGNSD